MLQRLLHIYLWVPDSAARGNPQTSLRDDESPTVDTFI